MSLKDKTIVVTGGSRGLGLGLVEALLDRGAKVTVVARGQAALAAVEQRLGVAVIPADITDEGAAQRILADVRPDILVLNAGATPPMGRLDQMSWADFTTPWETDVKGGLYWMQAALNVPLAPGARVLVASMGGAREGSPLSGGYAGAKHMLWLMAKYANGVAEQKGSGTGRWASSARRSWPDSARRCRRASTATIWSRCWTIRGTPKASPSA
jgi:NAD(P)-dependent dehydrogenase (short-subunit alcohol dehydrogenase family)